MLVKCIGLSWDGMYTWAQKITWMQMMFTWSCVFKPQSSYVFKWTYITINMWQIQKTRISLSITWNSVYFPKRNKMTYFNWVWNWCSCIKDKIDLSTSIGNMQHGAANISIYWRTYQSMNHNKLESRIYFWTFITVMKICTDCGAFSTLNSKAISLSQVTSLCHTIEWYYLRDKVFWCGFGWSWEYIFWLSVW